MPASPSGPQRLDAYFRSGGNPHQPLVLNQLAHLWVGPGRRDFHPALVVGAEAWLKKCQQEACDRNAAINWILARIRDLGRGEDTMIDFLELRYSEGEAILAARAKRPELPPPPSSDGNPAAPRFDQLSPEEQAEQRAAIEAARNHLPQSLRRTIDDAAPPKPGNPDPQARAGTGVNQDAPGG